MQNKKIIISMIIGASIFSQAILPAFAQTVTPETTTVTMAPEQAGNYNLSSGKIVKEVAKIANQASRTATVNQSRLPAIITRADTMITTRITSLQKLMTRVQSDQRLTSDEQKSLIADIQTQITGLQTLKTKIDADTDATTALADSKSVITNYYVYAVYEPKTQLLVTLNNLKTVITSLQAMVPQLQTLITTYGSGTNATQLQSLLTDISTQLTTMNTSLTTDITSIEGVSISSQTTAKTTFTQVRTDIMTVFKTGLTKIRTDIEQMRPLLKVVLATPTGTNAASSSAGTTVPGTANPPSTTSATTNSSANVQE